MARLDAEGQLEKLMKVHEEEEEEVIQYPFCTLLDARIDIAKYSIVTAASRLERAKRKRDDPDEDVEAEMDWALRQAESLVLDCSEIGDDRPLSGCSFSADGKSLATSSLSGVAKLWSMPLVRKVSNFKGHTERVTDVTFSPVNECLATASPDPTARLWSFKGVRGPPIPNLGMIRDGQCIATVSHDRTIKLWSVNSKDEQAMDVDRVS